MNDQTINMALTYLAATGGCASLLQALQRWSKTPWITVHTAKINWLFKSGLALASSLGLSWAWTANVDHSHVLMIAIPSVKALGVGAIHFIGQLYAIHGTGKVLSINEAPPVPIIAVTESPKA